MTGQTRSTRRGDVPPRLSIIVLSRHRPQHLALCLTALERQDHPDFEIILVADPATVGLRPDLPLKRIAFDQPNISAARNLGLNVAAAGVVAFIDDDALALPHWASTLAGAFRDARVVAATGFTRGPDGLNWQARAERLAPSGETWPFQIDTGIDGFVKLPPLDGCPVSTIGTNCAFRRDALLKIGGFDPVFRYHLDESDVNMRLAARFRGALTAILPAAEVIHGIAAGPHRGQAGVPHSLEAVGRSAISFSRRYGCCPPPVEIEQRLRLMRHMLAGRLDPAGMAPLLRGLRHGILEAGCDIPPAPPEALAEPRTDFRHFPAAPPDPGAPVMLCGWHWQAAKLRRSAANAVLDGKTACLLLLTPTVIPHRLTMAPGGWWEQRGGLWGADGGAGQGWRRVSQGRKAAENRFRKAMSCRFAPFDTPVAGGFAPDQRSPTETI